MLGRVVWQNYANVANMLAPFIVRAMEVASTAEISGNFYQTTRRDNTEDSRL
jgi:hypothetical protein